MTEGAFDDDLDGGILPGDADDLYGDDLSDFSEGYGPGYRNGGQYGIQFSDDPSIDHSTSDNPTHRGVGRPRTKKSGPSGRYAIEGGVGRRGNNASPRTEPVTEGPSVKLRGIKGTIDPTLSESLKEPFEFALFTCYLKDARFSVDGEMQITFRIPSSEVVEAVKVTQSFHQLLSCQISKRTTRR